MRITDAFPFIILLTIAVGIVLIIAAIMETRHGLKTTDVVRRIYLYLVSFVTLLGIAIGVAGTLNVAFRSWIFTKAVYTEQISGSLPVPYMITKPATPVEEPQPLLSCTNGCTLTQEQKDAVALWESNYREWKRENNPQTQRAAQLIMSLSFLIIALLVFIPHWMLTRHDRRGAGGTTPLRVTYLWAVSFVMLLTSVVAAGFLLNTSLKAAFLKNTTGTVNRVVSYGLPPANITDVDAIANCGKTCGLSDETVQLAKEWRQDYTALLNVKSEDSERQNRHGTLAVSLAALLAAFPVFAWHFKTVWRETRESGSAKAV